MVGVEDTQAIVFGQAVVDGSGIVDVANLREAILHARVEIVGTMGRSRVNGSGALIHGDVVGENAKYAALEKWMSVSSAFEARTGERGERVRLDDVASGLGS